MPQFSLTISRWRMLRLGLKKKRARFADLRSMARRDAEDAEWLVANGFFVVGDGLYELTDKGRASADLGLYEGEWATGSGPRHAPPTKVKTTKTTPGRGRGRPRKEIAKDGD